MSTILVTGGTRGIGLAIARGLRDRGHEVVATGARSTPDDEPGLDFVLADVTDAGAVAELADRFDRLDGLVNSAGVIRRAEEFDPEVFTEVVDTNLLGTMRTITACRSALAAAGGSVVNVASILSLFGSGFAPAYSTSKGGIAQLTRSLAVAFADDGIRVNAVLPGWIRTDMTSALRDAPEREADILGRTPMGRWGDADELVGPVAFLLDPDAASFVTGTLLVADGGYSCR